jgi:hypothetical protein
MLTSLVTVVLHPCPPLRQLNWLASCALTDSKKSPLCFHNLTNCFSRSSFPFITIQITRGCTLPCVISTAPPRLISFLSHACALFWRMEIFNSHVFSPLRTLCEKHGEWGPPRNNNFNCHFQFRTLLRSLPFRLPPPAFLPYTVSRPEDLPRPSDPYEGNLRNKPPAAGTAGPRGAPNVESDAAASWHGYRP